MKKLIVRVLVVLSMVLLISGCGTEDVDWDDFFNEYFSECVSYCATCAEWGEMCNIDYNAGICVDERWRNGSSNNSCVSGKQKTVTMIEEESCDTTLYIWHCLNF